MFSFFVGQITSESIFFFSKFSDFKFGFLVEADNLHVEITDLVVFLVAIFLQFSDLEFVFFGIAEITSFKVLNFKMLLIFEFVDLDTLDVFYFTCFFL